MEKGIIKIIKILIIFHSAQLINGVKLQGPCRDFYDYACRNQSSLKLVQQLENEYDKEVFISLSSRSDIDYGFFNFIMESKLVNNSLKYFEACRNEKGNLTKYLEEIKDLEDTNFEFQFWPFLGKIHSYGLNGIIVTHNIYGGSYKRFDLTLKPVLNVTINPLPDQAELQDLLAEYGFENAETIIHDLKKIQTELTELGRVYDNVTLAAQGKRVVYTKLSLFLQHYVKNLLPETFNEHTTYINLRNPKYFEYLIEKNYTTQDMERIFFYLKINFLYYLKEHRILDFSLEECVKDFRKNFKEPENIYYFVELFTKYLPKYPKTIEQIPGQIRTTAMKLLEENQLNLSEEQKQYLINKINKTEIKLAEVFDFKTNQMEYYFNMPDFNQTNYYKNHLQLMKYKFHFNLENELRLNVNKTLPPKESILPYYDAQKKEVKIPLKNLHPPILHSNSTAVQMVALFGFMVARELTRAINNQSLKNDYHFIPFSIINHNNFTNSLNCLKTQNPLEDINEQISDLFAVRVAYNLYQEHYATAEKNRTKKFFKNMAIYYCGENLDPNVTRSDAERLRQIVRNFEPFAEAFQCPVGSPMNPLEKCRLY